MLLFLRVFRLNRFVIAGHDPLRRCRIGAQCHRRRQARSRPQEPMGRDQRGERATLRVQLPPQLPHPVRRPPLCLCSFPFFFFRRRLIGFPSLVDKQHSLARPHRNDRPDPLRSLPVEAAPRAQGVFGKQAGAGAAGWRQRRMSRAHHLRPFFPSLLTLSLRFCSPSAFDTPPSFRPSRPLRDARLPPRRFTPPSFLSFPLLSFPLSCCSSLLAVPIYPRRSPSSRFWRGGFDRASSS